MSEEQRKHPRIDSLHLSYLCVDDSGTVVEKNMGRTLNVSESGLCLETHFPISTAYQLLLTIALEDELVEVKGRVAYCHTGKNDTFETGVELFDMDEENTKLYRRYVRLFQDQQAST